MTRKIYDRILLDFFVSFWVPVSAHINNIFTYKWHTSKQLDLILKEELLKCASQIKDILYI
jgi:hypothetical protein